MPSECATAMTALPSPPPTSYIRPGGSDGEPVIPMTLLTASLQTKANSCKQLLIRYLCKIVYIQTGIYIGTYF